MPRCGLGRVRADALDLEFDAVGGGEQRTRPRREVADRKAGRGVHPVHFLDAEAVHHAVVDHGLAAGAAFFGGLEDHDRGAVEIAGLGEILGGPEQHGGVAVVAAGVHGAGGLRRVGQPGQLLHRQGVHVRPHADHAAGFVGLAANDADDAGPADAGHHLVAAEFDQLVLHQRGGAMHLIEDLRMRMDIAAPFGDLILERRDTIDDGHGNPRRGCFGGVSDLAP